MFTTSCGWLKYRPFSNYELPTPHYVTDEDHNNVEVEFRDRRTGKVHYTRRLWFLRWPGQTEDAERAKEAQVPAEIVERWPDFEGKPGEGSSHYSVWDILTGGWLPPEVPETLAYHLAVNYKVLGLKSVPYPVCGLPAARVQEVIDGRFAFDSKATAAITYLKWVAESHRSHPLLQSFDTNVRETLMGLQQESVHLFFYLVHDYLYDPEMHWWSRNEKGLWLPMSKYLHWVGRTGMGLYGNFAGFEVPWHVRRAQEELEKAEDLKARMEEWDMWQMRDHMRDDDRELITEVGGDAPATYKVRPNPDEPTKVPPGASPPTPR